MKRFLINLLVTVLGFYVVVSFVSFTPSPFDWEVGGRAAFALFTLIVAGTWTAVEELDPKNSKS
jgi:hypothetical protein